MPSGSAYSYKCVIGLSWRTLLENPHVERPFSSVQWVFIGCLLCAFPTEVSQYMTHNYPADTSNVLSQTEDPIHSTHSCQNLLGVLPPFTRLLKGKTYTSYEWFILFPPYCTPEWWLTPTQSVYLGALPGAHHFLLQNHHFPAMISIFHPLYHSPPVVSFWFTVSFCT